MDLEGTQDDDTALICELMTLVWGVLVREVSLTPSILKQTNFILIITIIFEVTVKITAMLEMTMKKGETLRVSVQFFVPLKLGSNPIRSYSLSNTI